MKDNPSCSLNSRTQVFCSEPVKGNYAQTEMHRRAAADRPKNPESYGNPPTSGTPRARYPNAGQKARIDAATQEIRMRPRDADAYLHRALIYMELPSGGGKPLPNMDLGVADLEQALKLNPRSFITRHDYAQAAYLLGNQTFAISEFGKAIALNPSSAQSFLGRGWAYVESCRSDNATTDFTHAVRLDPSLQAKVAGQQYMVSKKNECAALAYQAAHPVQTPRSGANRNDPYFDHNSDYWRQRRQEEGRHSEPFHSEL